jgi:starch synthase
VNVLFAASEGVPFCKTGGLADVVGALPAALASAGHRVIVFLPLYRSVNRRRHNVEDLHQTVVAPFLGGSTGLGLWRSRVADNLDFYFLEADVFSSRDGLYGPLPGQDFDDNDRRFILFSRAVPEAARALRFRPDIVHCHDWQTGLIPAYLKTDYRSDPFFASTASVFTIHNLAYQGRFPGATFAATGLPASEFGPAGLEFWGDVNFLKAGIVYSDMLNTVSETYAEEIASGPEYGFALEGVLQDRRARLRGNVNGLDTALWNPATDLFLEQHFSAKSAGTRRTKCKADLRAAAELATEGAPPVRGFVGRLDRQKGIDILVEMMPELLSKGVQFVALGVGDPGYRDALLALQRRYPSQMRFETGFAEPLAHKIYGGADIFLMPSRFEPCGLGQMIAMRYGAVPVVTPTGGLLDTVSPVTDAAHGVGFVASAKTTAAYTSAVYDALSWLKRPKEWARIRRRAMEKDFRWDASVPEYEKLYRAALKVRKAARA